MKLLSIQYLRGMAALLVVFYHIFVQLNRLGRSEPAAEFLGGGVDIFFVISGFIMWFTTARGNIGPIKFFRHRIIRIVPIYWIVTTFYLVILLTTPSLMYSAKFDLFHVVASYLFIPTTHPVYTNAMWPIVIPGWTLNFEMFFYVVFALSLLFKKFVRPVVVIGFLCLIACLHAFGPKLPPIIAFYSSSIVLEFAFGVMLGYLYTSGVSISVRSSFMLLLVGLLGLIAGGYVAHFDLPRAIGFGVPALMIVTGAVFYERENCIAEIGFAKLVGDASYSIYLSHGAVLSAVGTLWHHEGLSELSAPIAFTLFMMNSLIAVLVVGIGLYWLVERPLLRYLTGHSKSERPARSIAG